MADEFRYRRFCLSKRVVAALRYDDAVAEVWRSKQEAQPGGTELPVGFPEKDALNTVGYVAQGDLLGADECELADWVGLTEPQARAVLAAAAAL